MKAECISTKEGLECQEKGCKCENNQCIVKMLLSIDNEDDAIAYAKTDKDFFDASKKMSESGNLLYNSFFDEKNDYWEVSISSEGNIDYWYFIKFNPDGTILEDGILFKKDFKKGA
jgi:hypothetical protein